jgi:DNA-binding MarR family transcriptional regulator
MVKTAPESLQTTLTDFMLLAKQQIAAIGESYNLPPLQTLTLMALGQGASWPMKTFCTVFACDPSNITGIIDGLEKKGLVARHAKPGDRRVKMVSLEPKGLEVRTQILNELMSEDGLILSPITAEEQVELQRILAKVTVQCPFSSQATSSTAA